MKTKFLLTLTFSVALMLGNAQSTIELLGTQGTGGPTGSGPSSANQLTTFYSNSSSPCSPVLTAAFSLNNQQFTTVEGNPGAFGTVFGGNNSTGVNTPIPGTNYYVLTNFLSSGQANNMYTVCNNCPAGTGFSTSSNYGIEIFSTTDALIGATGNSSYALNSQVQFSDITITFSRPVSNPVMHVTGLGGTNTYSTTISGSTTNYDLGFTTMLELLTPGLALNKLSGNSVLSVSGSVISNTATRYGSASTTAALNGVNRTAASGSVAILGTNITSVSFRIYLKGDGGIVVNNTGTTVPANNGNTVRWALPANFVPGGVTTGTLNQISGDAFIMGFSLQQPVTVSGNVFHDPNGGNVNNSTGTTNTIPTGMNANLIDASGKVVATALVDANGAYTFAGIFEGNYHVSISTLAGIQSMAEPAPSLPIGWLNTGTFIGLPNTGNSAALGTSRSFIVAQTDVTNINFGIEQPPVANNQSQTINQPINNTIPAGWVTQNISGADADGGAGATTVNFNNSNTIIISSLPTNASMYYNGLLVNSGQLITNFNPSLLSYTNIALGANAVVFEYAFVDAANIIGSAATYTINWLRTLPITITRFTTAVHNCNSTLVEWDVDDAIDFEEFEVERSKNGGLFETINTIKFSAQKKSYNFTDSLLPQAKYSYRLKLINKNRSFSYSRLASVTISCKPSKILVYPNPVTSHVIITGLKAETGSLAVYNSIGTLLYRGKIINGMATINTNGFRPGVYQLQIAYPSENYSIKIIKLAN